MGSRFRDLLYFSGRLVHLTFEASISEVVGDVGAQAGAAEVKRRMVPLLRMLLLLKVWRPSSQGVSKLLKSSLLGSLSNFLCFPHCFLLCLNFFSLC